MSAPCCRANLATPTAEPPTTFLPPLCLLAAVGLVRIVRLARQVPIAGLLLVIPLAALGMTAQTDAPYYVGNTLAEVANHLYIWPEYRYQNALVAAIRRRVPPGT